MTVRRENVPGICYLIHAHGEVGTRKPAPKPGRVRVGADGVGTASHYIGWTEGSLDARLAAHRRGNGSALMAAFQREGIEWEVAQTWENVDRHFERRLKRRGSAKRFCPLCPGSVPVGGRNG